MKAHMTWTYQHNPDLAIIEVAFVSNTSARDLQECTSKMIAIEKEEGVNRFLVDSRKMQLDASLLDVHEIPAEQYVVEQADRDGKVALILSTARFEHQAGMFYRDACQNRGWMVEAFADRQAALDWLTGSGKVCATQPSELPAR